MAKEKAKGILVDAGREGLAALQAHSQRATSKSVGEAIDHYLRVSKIASRQSNVNRLLRLLRGTLGGTNEQVRAKPLSVLTPALVAKYLADWKGSIYTLRGVLVSARAVFCHALDWEGFPLPESLEKFAKTTKGMRAPSPTFERIAPAILDGMDQASKQRAPAIRRAFLLTRYLGMTPKECSLCRRAWIEERNGKFDMVVIERDGVTLKTLAVSAREFAAAEKAVDPRQLAYLALRVWAVQPGQVDSIPRPLALLRQGRPRQADVELQGHLDPVRTPEDGGQASRGQPGRRHEAGA
jgi:hypothetical protein